LFADDPADAIDDPLARFRIPQVQQLVFARLPQQPFRMVFIKPGAGRDPLRLKPENRLETVGVSFRGDRR
jgi:hypothetical protein